MHRTRAASSRGWERNTISMQIRNKIFLFESDWELLHWFPQLTVFFFFTSENIFLCKCIFLGRQNYKSRSENSFIYAANTIGTPLWSTMLRCIRGCNFVSVSYFILLNITNGNVVLYFIIIQICLSMALKSVYIL